MYKEITVNFTLNLPPELKRELQIEASSLGRSLTSHLLFIIRNRHKDDLEHTQIITRLDEIERSLKKLDR